MSSAASSIPSPPVSRVNLKDLVLVSFAADALGVGTDNEFQPKKIRETHGHVDRYVKNEFNDTHAHKYAAEPEKPVSAAQKLYLHTCNLGDSGFCVVRDSRVIFHSSPQRDVHHVHQLAVIPQSLRTQHQDSEYEYADDKPDDALCACCELQENDVIILASDGLWDNIQPKDEIVTVPGVGLARLRYKQDAPERTLFQHQTIAQCIIDSRVPGGVDVDVEKVCERLAIYAVELMGMQEGKPDDLTLLCTQIKKHNFNKSSDDSRSNSRINSPTSIMSVDAKQFA